MRFLGDQKILNFLELGVDSVTVTPHPLCSYGKSAGRKQKRDWRLRREIPARSVGSDSQAQRDHPQAVGRGSGNQCSGKRPTNFNTIKTHIEPMGETRRKGDSHLRYIGAQVSASLKNKVERLAKRQDMSVSQLLRRELKEMVASK
jgi:hypothetical protein